MVWKLILQQEHTKDIQLKYLEITREEVAIQ